MKLTRYEFGGIGIFHALEVIEELPMSKADEDDLLWAEKEFDKCLEIPSVSADLGGENKFISYFTPNGEKNFSDCLDIVLNLFYQAEDAGLGILEKKEIDSSELSILYQDDNQVIANACHKALL